MANFVLLGAAGFIAPRHLDAIKDSGHKLVAAYDPSDSAGILDRHFPDCAYFTRFEKLESFIDSFPEKIDYVTICSPNFLHFDQVRWAMRLGAKPICEKPLVLTVHELDELLKYERKLGLRASTILQMRVHPAIRELKKKIEHEDKPIYKVNVSYITSRGPWYLESWKGDVAKSGGLATNIGIHFFDMLTWIFGPHEDVTVEQKFKTYERGTLQLKKAEVHWDLSTDRHRLPPTALKAGKTTYRSITIDGTEFEFSDGFTELHRTVYKDIFAGGGYGIEDVRESIGFEELNFF